MDKDSNNNGEGNVVVGGIVSDLKDVGDAFVSIKSGFEKILSDMSSMMISKEDAKKNIIDEKVEVSNSDIEATTIYHCSNLEGLVEELRDDF